MLKLLTLTLSMLILVFFFKRSMLTYTTRHRLLSKRMSYSKKYTKKKAKTTSILVKIDVIRCITTSTLRKTMLNCVFWNTFYISYEKTDVHLQHRFLTKPMLNVLTTSILVKIDVVRALSTSVLNQLMLFFAIFKIFYLFYDKPTKINL